MLKLGRIEVLQKMISKIEYTTIHGVSVSVPLLDLVTIIGGDSSTGKSFIKDTVQEYYNDAEKAVIEVFDYKRPIDIAVLRALKDRLIIIDNADILLSGNEAVCQHISADKDNKYLLFMRGENGIDVSIDNYAELHQEGKKLTAIYEYSTERG